eukprot:g7301.t1
MTSPVGAGPKFSAGSVVRVDARLEPGSNKPGGVARVQAAREQAGNGELAHVYDVRYVLGGREKGVPEHFVHAADIGGTTSGENGDVAPATKRLRPSPALVADSPSTWTGTASPASGGGGGDGGNPPEGAATLLALTARVRALDQYGIFHAPVDLAEAPDYCDVISEPLDLATIDTRVRRGEVRGVAALRTLLHRMLDNCLQYNAEDSFEARQARRVRAAAARLLAAAERREAEAVALALKRAERAAMAAEDAAGAVMRAAERDERRRAQAERRKRARAEGVGGGGAGAVSAAARSVAAPGAYFASDAPIFGAAHTKRYNHTTGPLDRHVRRAAPWSDATSAALSAGVADIAASAAAEHFRYPVSRKVFPEYYEEIATPMDLQLMAERLAAHRYSALDELRRDFALLHANCLRFNEAGAPIVAQAAAVRRAGDALLLRLAPVVDREQREAEARARAQAAEAARAAEARADAAAAAAAAARAAEPAIVLDGSAGGASAARSSEPAPAAGGVAATAPVAPAVEPRRRKKRSLGTLAPPPAAGAATATAEAHKVKPVKQPCVIVLDH